MSRHGRFVVTKYSDDDNVPPINVPPPSEDMEMSTDSSDEQACESTRPLCQDSDVDDLEKELFKIFLKEPDPSEPRPFSCPTQELYKPIPRIPLGFDKNKGSPLALTFTPISSKQPEHSERPSVSQSQEQNVVCLRPPTPLPRFPEDLVFVFEESTSNMNTKLVRLVLDLQSRRFPFVKQIYIPMSLNNFMLQFNNRMECYSQSYSHISKSGAQKRKYSVNTKAIEAAPKVIVLPDEKKDSPKAETEHKDEEMPGLSPLAEKAAANQLYTIDDVMDSDDDSDDEEFLYLLSSDDSDE